MYALLASKALKWVLGGLAVCIVVYSIYHTGYESGKGDSDKLWTDKYNEYIDDFNKKAGILEKNSKETADQVSKELEETKKQLEKMVKEKEQTTEIIYVDSGKEVTCAKNIDIKNVKLGKNVADMWNEMNSYTEVK